MPAANFKFRPFLHDTRICWHPATDLLTGRPIWVPAQLATLYYKYRAGEPSIGYPTSGGLGFAATRRGAILHGLYEFMERDAINVRWFCRLPPPRVRIDIAATLGAPLAGDGLAAFDRTRSTRSPSSSPRSTIPSRY